MLDTHGLYGVLQFIKPLSHLLNPLIQVSLTVRGSCLSGSYILSIRSNFLTLTLQSSCASFTSIVLAFSVGVGLTDNVKIGESSGADTGVVKMFKIDGSWLNKLSSTGRTSHSLGCDQGTSGTLLQFLGVPPSATPGDWRTGWRGGSMGWSTGGLWTELRKRLRVRE